LRSGNDGFVTNLLRHVMTDNRHGIAIHATLTEANGRAERAAALAMAAQLLPGVRN
jgi:uncharacterized heparinase superfamily protein